MAIAGHPTLSNVTHALHLGKIGLGRIAAHKYMTIAGHPTLVLGHSLRTHPHPDRNSRGPYCCRGSQPRYLSLTIVHIDRAKAILHLEKVRREHKLSFYRPYPKQLEYHNLLKRERLFIAGNQAGKTTAGAFEIAYHLTGLYPDWWVGLRFPGPIRMTVLLVHKPRDNRARLPLPRKGWREPVGL
jgi:hypothetical protein